MKLRLDLLELAAEAEAYRQAMPPEFSGNGAMIPARRRLNRLVRATLRLYRAHRCPVGKGKVVSLWLQYETWTTVNCNTKRS